MSKEHLVTCPNCDGAGEWDEGPMPASSGATEPDYRQVICPQCQGTGTVFVEAEARTFDDLDAEDQTYRRCEGSPVDAWGECFECNAASGQDCLKPMLAARDHQP